MIPKKKRRENFERVANDRISRIKKLIVSLRNLTNKQHYDYDEPELKEIFDTLQDILDENKRIVVYGEKEFKL